MIRIRLESLQLHAPRQKSLILQKSLPSNIDVCSVLVTSIRFQSANFVISSNLCMMFFGYANYTFVKLAACLQMMTTCCKLNYLKLPLLIEFDERTSKKTSAPSNFRRLKGISLKFWTSGCELGIRASWEEV